MKKITFLLLLTFICSLSFAQRVDPTFVWTNKSDYQINGEEAVTFTPGQVVSYNIDYTLGSTNGVEDTGGFFLFGVQDEPMANVDVLDGSLWANNTIGCSTGPCNNYAFGQSGNYTVVASAALSSSDPNLTYRVLTYRAYTPDGGSQVFGGDGSSDQVLVYIRSQAEIDAILSANKYNKTKLDGFYSAERNAIVLKRNIDGNFKIFNMLGQSVQEGEVSQEINVETLKTGLYILTTDNGTLKFVK